MFRGLLVSKRLRKVAIASTATIALILFFESSGFAYRVTLAFWRGTVSTSLLSLVAGHDLGSDGTGPAASFNFPKGTAVDSSGNVYVADTVHNTIRKITSAGVVTTLAGALNVAGSVDGTGSSARFNAPYGLAVDSSGNIFVADSGNNSIRKITSAGVVTTLAGAGPAADGTGAAARFFSPTFDTVDSSGNVYVADSSNYTIRKITSAGVVTTLAGSAGVPGTADGTGSAARFDSMAGVAVDSSGNVYVADMLMSTIRKVTPAGVVTTFAGTAQSAGSTDGTGSAARFNRPDGIAVDSSGNVFVSDASNFNIRKITSAGVVTTFAGGSPGADGTGTAARIDFPSASAVDSSGNVYVADSGNHIIRKITSAGVVTTIAGTVGAQGISDGTGAAARFSNPTGVAVDASGNVYVSDSDNNTIRKITSAGVVTTFAGTAGMSGSADGTGAAARFSHPIGIAVDSSGNVFVADSYNHTIRKITSGGVVTTLAGTAGVSGSADGSGGSAGFSYPSGLSIDSTGNLYVGEVGNYTIRKITSGGVVTTLAGSPGVPGDTDGTGAAARFSVPNGVAVDSTGNVFVADHGAHTIRKVTSAGVVTTFAGASGVNGSANGTGSSARFSAPDGVSVDTSGNLYVADYSNRMIRKVTSAGVVTTFAGAPLTADGTGAAARFNQPKGIAVDSSGNVFVADLGNSTIRKITSAGVVTTFAGIAGLTGSADGTGTAASFSYPRGITVDTSGNLYVTDSTNHTIRKITSGAVVSTLAGTAGVFGGSDGTGAAASFSTPYGISVDGTGAIFVVDNGNNSIRKVTSAGVVTTFAGGQPGADGTGAAARFFSPSGVAVDSTGNVYVTDSQNQTIRKVTSAGVVTTLAGAQDVVGSADGTGAAASFNFPYGIAVDSSGNVFVADSYNSTIRKITSAGVVTTLAGTAGSAGSADGSGAAASFNTPEGLAIDGSGNLFVADSANSAIRKVTSAGAVTTLAGAAGVTGSTDATGASASFYLPEGIAVDSSANTYVADTANSLIRKISPAGVVTTLAGTRLGSDGTGALASFGLPVGLAFDSSGNAFIADAAGNTIRKVTSAGVVTTLAGTVGATGATDGTGASASFSVPYGVAVDSSGNVFVVDSTNSTIRQITPAGVVTTFAGTAGVSGANDGTGASAQFSYPAGIAIDTSGNLYVSDTLNNTIRKITSAGVVTTLAGTAGVTGSADGTGASASFNSPIGIAIDSSGNLYVAESGNHIVRKITTGGVVTTLAGTAGVVGSADGTGSSARFNAPIGVTVDASGNLYIADSGNYLIRKVTSAGVVTTVVGTLGFSQTVTGPLPGKLAAPSMLALYSGYLYMTVGNSFLKAPAP